MPINPYPGAERDINVPRTPPVKEDVDQSPNPPDSIPDILPGVDPEQTPGIDHLTAEQNPHDRTVHRHSS